jgi:myxalamid-type nonribosomal peptide synthetase MxaA
MTVLVSGASGYLGRALLRALDEPVVAVMRRADQSDRAAVLSRRTGVGVDAVAGDLHRPLWGLDEATLDGLRGRVSLVVNGAAQASWAAGWHDLMATNVEGARRAVDVAATLGVPLVHVSSLYAAHDCGRHVPEALVDEAVHLTKYERSKNRSEHAVADAAADLGVPTTIVRVGGLGGDIDPVPGERAALPPMLRLLDRDGWGWVPYVPNARIDVAPRDLVARTVVGIMREPAPPEGVAVVRNVGLGHASPNAGALLTEAARLGMGYEKPVRPVPSPAKPLMAISELADRFGRGRRTTLLIGVRYFASSTVYLSSGLGQDVSLAALVRTLVRRPRLEPATLPSFYERWI